MMLKHHGFEAIRYEKILKEIGKQQPEAWGSGWKSAELRWRRELYDRGNKVIKLWSKKFEFSTNILDGIRSEFYGELLTPALVGVIIDDDVDVRGYVMHKGNRLTHDKYMFKILNDLYSQTRLTGYCFPDCIRENMGMWDGKTTLFDLECVVKTTKNIKTKLKIYDEVIDKLASPMDFGAGSTKPG